MNGVTWGIINLLIFGQVVHTQPTVACSKLTIKNLEQGKKYVGVCSGVFIVNSEHISHLVLVFLLLTLGR